VKAPPKTAARGISPNISAIPSYDNSMVSLSLKIPNWDAAKWRVISSRYRMAHNVLCVELPELGGLADFKRARSFALKVPGCPVRNQGQSF